VEIIYLTIFVFIKITQVMIRINDETASETLQDIKIGDLVTDGFSKTSLVERIEVNDDGMYKIYEFHLLTGRVITTKR
jgi:hypothetical protein